MPEAREELILEINVSNSVEELAGLRQSLDQLIKQRQDLAEKSIAGDIAATKELEKLNSTIRNTQTEYKAQQRVLDGYSAAQKTSVNTSNLQANSIKTNRDLLKQLTAQYINLKNPSANATSQIKHLTDVLKGQEAAIGNTSRNVGNYREGIQQAFSGLSSLAGGFGGASKAALGFGSALATGTGGLSLIIPAIVQFIELVSTNAEVADQLSFAMGGINKVFQTFADLAFEGVKRLGFLKNAFNDPIGTIKELGQVILDNLTNRLKSVLVFGESISLFFRGKWSESAKAFTNATLQLTTGVEGLSDKLTGAFESGSKTAQMLDELGGKQIELNGAAAIAQKQAEALVKSLKDRTKSEEERIKIATRAADLEIKAADLIAKSKQVEIDLEKERLKGITATDEQKNKLRELELDRDLALLDKQTIASQRQTRINILLEQQNSDEKAKAKQKELDRLLELEKKHREDVANLQIEFELTEREKLEDSFASKQAILNANSEEELRLINEIELKKQEALEKFDNDQIERNRKKLATISSQNVTSSKEYTKQLEEDEKKREAIQEAELQFSQSISSSLIGFIRDVADASGASAAFSKAVAAIEIGVKTALALVGAIAQAQAVPYPANLVAIATGVAAVTAGIASAVALFKKVPDNPGKPKFALGGGIDIDGLPHSGGGTPIHVNGRLVAEAEAGEKMFILKKSASEQIGLLSAFNQFFGGRSFAGGKVSHAAAGGFISDGGFATRELSRGVDNGLLMTEAIKQGFRLAPPVELSIVELNSKQASRNRSVNISEA